MKWSRDSKGKSRVKEEAPTEFVNWMRPFFIAWEYRAAASIHCSLERMQVWLVWARLSTASSSSSRNGESLGKRCSREGSEGSVRWRGGKAPGSSRMLVSLVMNPGWVRKLGTKSGGREGRVKSPMLALVMGGRVVGVNCVGLQSEVPMNSIVELYENQQQRSRELSPGGIPR